MKQLRILKSALQLPVIISLFDYSGIWSAPYRKAGYRVLQIDTKLGFNIFNWNYKAINPGLVFGILAAPPCTDFAGSGAQYWKAKDTEGRTSESIKIIKKVFEIVRYFKPKFWVIENPVGRLNELIPELRDYGPWYFQPCWFGDSWSKKTGLWGKYNRPKIKNVNGCSRVKNAWIMKIGGKSEKTKELRSITPPEFANAFFKANNLKDNGRKE